MKNLKRNEQVQLGIDRSQKIDVHSTFDTIQGEGPFSGRPCTFLRLYGCNLQCPMCDTDYTSIKTPREATPIANTIDSYYHHHGLVVITGGEPFRQNIDQLVLELAARKIHVQIETNGTLYPGDNFPWEYTTIVCSPKTNKINPQLAPHIDYMKYVIEDPHYYSVNGLPTKILGMDVKIEKSSIPSHIPKQKVYIQPCDSGCDAKNDLNLKAAIRICKKNGYTLCLQIHKIANLE